MNNCKLKVDNYLKAASLFICKLFVGMFSKSDIVINTLVIWHYILLFCFRTILQVTIAGPYLGPVRHHSLQALKPPLWTLDEWIN